MESTVSQRTLQLIERVNNNVMNLNKRFDNIIQLAPIDDKDKCVTAAEVYQIEVHAAAMIRAAEDLLALTRSLKEAWLFGQLGSSFNTERPETDASAVEVAKALLNWHKKSTST
ncbi:surfeit locus protein 5 subunit 22 of mediator complex-domain-containing protein [Kalaharituber pfeilii]|nr:surfeit locus protein 5 subunit 22 of mediator complex-domain-containing protein [Kalaharituber pfeilii]